MPTLAELDRLRAHPEPAYPQYDELRVAARAMGSLIDPRELGSVQAVIARRGPTWCTAVLGFWMPAAGLRGLTTVEARLLVLADDRDLDPPEPAPVAAARASGEADAAGRASTEQALARELQRWRTALALCQVQVQVRANERGTRPDGTGQRTALRHVVPARAVESRTSGRRRRHLPGRALCETPTRAKPLRLAEPSDQHATCQRCLNFMPVIAPVAVPQGAPAAKDPHDGSAVAHQDQALDALGSTPTRQERTGYVIRAGRQAITDTDVASAHNYVSLRAAKRAGLFDMQTLPKPINQRGGQKRANKPLYDAAQIHAHAVGDPVPELPTDDHDDDLLDAQESAELWGISITTWEGYRRYHPQLIPPSVQVGGVLHWRRGDLLTFKRPGRGSGGGRKPGTRDTGPRRRRGEIEVAILQVLADGPRNGRQLAAEVAERSEGPVPASLHLRMAKLTEAGLVDSEMDGRNRVYHLTEAGRGTPAWQVLGGAARRTRVEEMVTAARKADRELTPEEVAAELGVHPEHARRLIAAAQD